MAPRLKPCPSANSEAFNSTSRLVLEKSLGEYYNIPSISALLLSSCPIDLRPEFMAHEGQKKNTHTHIHTHTFINKYTFNIGDISMRINSASEMLRAWMHKSAPFFNEDEITNVERWGRWGKRRKGRKRRKRRKRKTYQVSVGNIGISVGERWIDGQSHTVGENG